MTESFYLVDGVIQIVLRLFLGVFMLSAMTGLFTRTLRVIIYDDN